MDEAVAGIILACVHGAFPVAVRRGQVDGTVFVVDVPPLPGMAVFAAHERQGCAVAKAGFQ